MVKFSNSKTPQAIGTWSLFLLFVIVQIYIPRCVWQLQDTGDAGPFSQVVLPSLGYVALSLWFKSIHKPSAFSLWKLGRGWRRKGPAASPQGHSSF